MGRKASSSSSKHRTRGVCNEQDRISQIPDDILCHILSSLSTKDAVASSILSKRWKHVWTSVPIIEITDYDDFVSSKSPEINGRFMDFVDRVLRLNDISCLQKLCLTCRNCSNSSRVSTWISAVIMREMETLDLNFWNENAVDLVEFPLANMFACKKLATLMLSGKIFLNVSSAVYLPCVKILHLDLLESLDDDSVKNLLSGCPVLEEFYINRRCDKLTTLFVQSSSLKRLEVYSEFDDDIYDIPLVVDTINLEEIYLSIHVPQQFEANGLPSLVKVTLELRNCYPEIVGMNVYGNRIVELLRQISNTKHLFLSLEVMEALGYTSLYNLPMLHNLTHLKVETYSCCWPILPALLERSPNLISIRLYNDTDCDEIECHQQFHTPKCSMLYLERIKVSQFQGNRDEMKIVRYFLKNSPVLKKMSIRYKLSLSTIKKSKVRHRIAMLQKGSTDWEIEFI